MFGASVNIFFLVIITTTIGSITADVNIITKAEWNGREPKADLSKLTTPVERVIIAHTAGAVCQTLQTCSQQARMLQEFHMNKSKFDDIGYNFMVGNDGNVYEGRGWDQVGAFAFGYNAGSLGIAFFGIFDSGLPNEAALNAAKSLLETGVTLGKISNNYRLYGHRQLSATISPGTSLYEEIKKWPHWSREVV